ncbi:MAG: prephenate dehydrogenase/arogenate dehydrogenase family protein [Actinomycetota bacterium]
MNVSVVGTGLIGGSVGLAARRAGHRVTGFDRDPASTDGAIRSGAIDRACVSLAEACSGADLVVLCAPVGAVVSLLDDPALQRVTGVVTDVSSTKADIVAAGSSRIGARFVGGHPMAGSERHGIEAADGRLFEDAWWILTPTHATDPVAYKVVSEFVSGLGAKPVAIEPDAHDELLARLSHLPQLVAAAVVAVAAGSGSSRSLLGLAAGGFRDVTRIAASQPEMWIDILATNRRSILEALTDLQGELDGLREALETSHWDGLRTRLETARKTRLEAFAKPDVPADSVLLSLLVPDRPGVLAEVTTAAGELGANIEDIQIFHSTEGGRGRLELVVAGVGPAQRLEDRLTSLGYHVDRGVPG